MSTEPIKHWAAPYVGIPYLKGGRSKEGVDCWGLVYLIYKEVFGIELPIYPGITAASLPTICGTIVSASNTDWTECEPFDGAAVGMSQYKALHHVGTYIGADGGKIIHAWDFQGGANPHPASSVVVDSILGLRQVRRFKLIKYYRHRLWPTS